MGLLALEIDNNKWEDRQDAKTAVTAVIELIVLAQASKADEARLDKMKTKELNEMLTALGLETKGKKSILVGRLLEAGAGALAAKKGPGEGLDQRVCDYLRVYGPHPTQLEAVQKTMRALKNRARALGIDANKCDDNLPQDAETAVIELIVLANQETGEGLDQRVREYLSLHGPSTAAAFWLEFRLAELRTTLDDEQSGFDWPSTLDTFVTLMATEGDVASMVRRVEAFIDQPISPEEMLDKWGPESDE